MNRVRNFTVRFDTIRVVGGGCGWVGGRGGGGGGVVLVVMGGH